MRSTQKSHTYFKKEKNSFTTEIKENVLCNAYMITKYRFITQVVNFLRYTQKMSFQKYIPNFDKQNYIILTILPFSRKSEVTLRRS